MGLSPKWLEAGDFRVPAKDSSSRSPMISKSLSRPSFGRGQASLLPTRAVLPSPSASRRSAWIRSPKARLVQIRKRRIVGRHAPRPGARIIFWGIRAIGSPTSRSCLHVHIPSFRDESRTAVEAVGGAGPRARRSETSDSAELGRNHSVCARDSVVIAFSRSGSLRLIPLRASETSGRSWPHPATTW